MCNSTDTACKLLNENDYFLKNKIKKPKWIVILMFSSSHPSDFLTPKPEGCNPHWRSLF